MTTNSMDTAPQDREILVWAQWDWDDMSGDMANGGFAWRVAEWRDARNFVKPGFWSVSDNPYSDRAVRPKMWAELPAEVQ
ncbi:MAG: hypothetical protein ACRCT6_13100 [Notoacmeibacter sp.]